MKSFFSYFTKYFLIGIIFYVVAAASNLGFYQKWNKHEYESTRYSIDQMLDGSAHRPFVYRRLIPTMANLIGDHISLPVQAKLTQFYSVVDRHFKYKLVYALSFLGAFLSLWTLRAVLETQNFSSAASLLAPILFILLLPYLQTIGGYYYDSWELFFLSLSIMLAIRGRWIFLLFVAAFATFNKESYLFFTPCIWPFLRQSISVKKSVLIIMAMAFIAGLINLYIKHQYSANPGGIFEFHLFTNIQVYSNLIAYFKSEFTYGLIGPSGSNLISLLFIIFLFIGGWKYLSQVMREHALICASINLPLFFILGGEGELRGLGFMYVTMTALMAGFFSHINVIKKEIP